MEFLGRCVPRGGSQRGPEVSVPRRILSALPRACRRTLCQGTWLGDSRAGPGSCIGGRVTLGQGHLPRAAVHGALTPAWLGHCHRDGPGGRERLKTCSWRSACPGSASPTLGCAFCERRLLQMWARGAECGVRCYPPHAGRVLPCSWGAVLAERSSGYVVRSQQRAGRAGPPQGWRKTRCWGTGEPLMRTQRA